MKLIVARDYRQFLNWCHDNKLSPHDRSIRFIDSAYDMRGFDKAEVIYYGTYYMRKDFHEIEQEVKYLESRQQEGAS